MAVHLHLLVLVFILLVPTPQQARGNVSHFSPMDDLSVGQIVPIHFNVHGTVGDDYKTFLHNLHRVLAMNPTHKTVMNVPVLAKQRGQDHVPARWIYVNLVGRNADKTTIAVRDDNIYIVGFNNSNGYWFEFKGPAHLIDGSTMLPFGSGYKDLVKGGQKNLKYIKLGQENMLEAVRRLAHHHHNSYDERLKRALATLCVMVAEAERFVPIEETVAQRWKGTPQITATQANYVVLWSDISRALLMWRKANYVGQGWTDISYKLHNKLQKAGINGPYDALRTLGLVLWPNDFKFSFDVITADDGKPLADDSSTTCNRTSCN